MGRNASIQMFLLTLTGCSWMLLFLSITLPDYHVFRVYRVARVAAAHATHTPPAREADPCEVCWGAGTPCLEEEDAGGSRPGKGLPSEAGTSSWGARLAWVLGMAAQKDDKVSSGGGAQVHKVAGVGAFYYYTLHTTFTTLAVKLKKAQQVAGDVKEEVAALGEKVAHLHHTLTTHFSPRHDPYHHKAHPTPPAATGTQHTATNVSPTHPNTQRTGRSKSEMKDLRSSKRRYEASVSPDAGREDLRRVYPVQVSNDAKRRKYSILPNDDQVSLRNINSNVPSSHSEQTHSVYPDGASPEISPGAGPGTSPRAGPGAILPRSNAIAHKYAKLQNSQVMENHQISQSANRRRIQTVFSNSFRHQLSVNMTGIGSEPSSERREGLKRTETEGIDRSRGRHWVVGTEETGNGRTKRPDDLHTNVDRVGLRRTVSVMVIDGEKNDFLTSLGNTYPGITVHWITRTVAPEEEARHHVHLVVHNVDANASTSVAYTEVLRHITTPYVLVATGISSLTSLAHLDRLVWAVEHLGVWAVGGGLEAPSAHWRTGCFTSSYAHYQASWARGRLASIDQCLLCHGLEGPFLALTTALRHLGWDTNLPRQVLQHDLFLRAAHTQHMLAAACPHSLFTISSELEPPSRAALLSLARRHSLYTVGAAGAPAVTFTCREVGASCGHTGLALPPCCRQELANLVRFLMDICEAHGLFCELQEGTLLGAVKVGGVLPWERDADITFHTKNFTALGELKDTFERAGYSLYLTDNRWCCVDGRWAGGQGSLSSGHWRAELWSQHAMDSEDNLLAGRPRTRVEFDGLWVPAPASPGQYVRNRYGVEVFRHAQHWLDTGRNSGWEEYEAGKFLPCGRPGHHACLDTHVPDGNLKLHPLCVT
nr:uncharacterized protein LOC123759901 [Procambarus clarkii]